jgi:hypothetical protein
MGTVTTVTISAINYSVYALVSDPVTEATNYFNGQLSPSATAWAAATADNRARALVTAARWLDRAVAWSGTKTSASQPLAWPRDNATCNGTNLGTNIVPDSIVYAQFELAGLILVDPTIAVGPGTGSNIKRVKAGSAEVEFFTGTLGTSSDTRLPLVAHDLVKCLYGSSGGSGGSFVTGTCEESAFEEDAEELNQGWS